MAIDFPDGSTGESVRYIIAAANEAMAPWAGESAIIAAEELRSMQGQEWRHSYPKHIVAHTQLLASSPGACLAGARAGLAALYETFRCGDVSLREAVSARPLSGSRLAFATGCVEGRLRHDSSGAAAEQIMRGGGEDDVRLPMGKDLQELDGDECLEKLRSWAALGVIEPDVVSAVEGLRARHGGQVDLRPWVLKKKKAEMIMKKNAYTQRNGGGNATANRSSSNDNGNDNGDGDDDESGDEDGVGEFVFVVLGAGAAMGPFETLLRLGAHVVAVDLPRPATWRRLLSVARNSKGKLSFPMARRGGGNNDDDKNNDGDDGGCRDAARSSGGRDGSREEADFDQLAERAGADLMSDSVALRDWLVGWSQTHLPVAATLVVGSYAYLDSSAFVRVSVAMDVVAAGVLAQRKRSGVAYLCSPTDVFAIPAGTRNRSNEAYHTHSHFGEKFARGTAAPALLPRALRPNVAEASGGLGPRLPLVDSLVVQQGPNYCFAKRLQHWRAMVSRADGFAVSSNVAPASNTSSVLSNPLIASAFEGASFVAPLEIFSPDTSNVLMTYLLLHDLDAFANHKKQHTAAAASSDHPCAAALDDSTHPLMLFASTAVHNGIWACAYQLRSVLEVVVIARYVKKYGRPAAATAAGVAAVVVAAAIHGDILRSFL